MIYRFENAKVLRVVDGDTIVCRIEIGFHLTTIQTFRFYRINAPESRTSDPVEKKKGLAAKKFLIDLIEGKDIVLETHKAGKFGRWLAEVIFEGVNVNDLMVLEDKAVYKDY